MVRCVRGTLAICGALGALGGFVVALAPAASAHQRPQRATTAAAVTFVLNLPADTRVAVRLNGGITKITAENAAGSNMQEFGTSGSRRDFAVLSSGGLGSPRAHINVTIDVHLSSAGPITGTATVPPGATLSATVDTAPLHAIYNGRFSISTSSARASTKPATPQ
jgi:hypothetical protein